jgi:hypothetical protein
MQQNPNTQWFTRFQKIDEYGSPFKVSDFECSDLRGANLSSKIVASGQDSTARDSANAARTVTITLSTMNYVMIDRSTVLDP